MGRPADRRSSHRALQGRQEAATWWKAATAQEHRDQGERALPLFFSPLILLPDRGVRAACAAPACSGQPDRGASVEHRARSPGSVTPLMDRVVLELVEDLDGCEGSSPAWRSHRASPRVPDLGTGPDQLVTNPKVCARSRRTGFLRLAPQPGLFAQGQLLRRPGRRAQRSRSEC